MESNVIVSMRLAALTEEIDAIHFANSLFWKHKETRTRGATAAYQSRKERLDQIRGELARLGAGTRFRTCTHQTRRFQLSRVAR